MASVVIASDNNYVPHLAALLRSVISTISPNYRLDLLVLDGGISNYNQRLLRRLVPAEHQLTLIPMQDAFSEHFVHMHFSRTTFYRLVLDQILASRQRVIYLDCDTIVLADLAELWELDLQGAPIAAVPDVIMHHFCLSQTLSADFTGSLTAADYLKTYLQIDASRLNAYFQAGLWVMDLAAMRHTNCSEKMVADLMECKYWFLDQDVLNKYFAATYLPLPFAWNYVNCQADILSSLLEPTRALLNQAGLQPKMIHFAGYEAKPWVNRQAYLAEHYFYYLRQTYWYEHVMQRLPSTLPNVVSSSTFSLRAALMAKAREVWRGLPMPARRLLNPIAYRCMRSLAAR